MFESFERTHTRQNYAHTSSSSIILKENDVTESIFVAEYSKLSSVRLFKDTQYSSLHPNDTINVSIFDENDHLLMTRESFLYNPNRNYIVVPLDGLSLVQGSEYRIQIEVVELSSESLLFFRMHPESIFDYDWSNVDDFDVTKGYRSVPNVAFDYSILSPVSAIIHLLFFVGLIVILLFDKILEKIRFKEIYRATAVVFFIFLVMEVLNAAKARPLQVFYPLEMRTYIGLIAGLLILMTLYFIVYAISARGWIASFIVLVIGLAIAYTNHAKIIMRGDPFMPWDIYAAGVAAKCSTGYDFLVTRAFIASFFMIPAVLIIIRLTHRKPSSSKRTRIVSFVLAAFLGLNATFGFVLNASMHEKFDISYALFPPLQSYSENNTIYSFILKLNNIKPEGGEDSSPEVVDSLDQYYIDEVERLNLNDHVVEHETQPNVIVVMSESYADYRDIRDIETSEPVMPFYDSMIDDTIHGDLQVSIFGGGTCNTEFEFLTGYSVAPLLPGSSVYTFYLSDNLYAMPQIYSDHGYSTIAIHPFDPQWWDRDVAYPYMGFDHYYSQDDFDDPKYMRRFISDLSAFERVIDEFESKPSDEPLFCFLVTMQNHADFSERYDNQYYDIKLESFPEHSFPYTENYLSLLRESDDALKLMIEYFESVDEPTIIVFFSDHLATMDHGFYDELLGIDISQMTLEESLPLYSVPYFIWSNYEMDTGYAGLTSPNFLGQTVLDLSGITSPDERASLRVLQTKISALSALAIFDLDGQAWTDRTKLDTDIQEVIKDYYRIQYASIYYDDEIKSQENEDRTE